MGFFDDTTDDNRRLASAGSIGGPAYQRSAGATGGWTPGPSGATGGWADAGGGAYDPDAGAIVPAPDFGPMVSGVGNAVQGVFSQMGANTGSGYAPPPGAGGTADVSIHPSATQPRRAGEFGLNDRGAGYNPVSDAAARSDFGMGDRGAGYVAPGVADPAPGVITRMGSSFTGTGGPSGAPAANPALDAISNKLALMKANEDQAFADRMDRYQQAGSRANAVQDLDRAQGAARVANFRATNGADMVLGSPGLYRDQRKGILAAADQANANVSALQGTVNGLSAPQPRRNYLDEFYRGQEVGNRSAVANAGIAESGARTAVDHAKVGETQADADLKRTRAASEKQVMDLRQKLANEPDAKKRKTLQDQLLAIEGKVAPQDKIVLVDADTGQKDMMGQPIYKKIALNATTGDPVGGTPERQGPTPPENHILALKQDPKKYRDAFDQKYGKGAADRYLNDQGQ